MSFESLNMAADSLRAQRLAMDVAARNLTGSSEAGYSRQVVVYSEDHSNPRGRYSQDIEGLGSRVAAIQRTRSGLLDQAYRLRSNANQDAQAPESHLTDLESRLSANPSLADQISDLGASLVQVQGDPGNLGLRQAYLQNLQAATTQVRTYAGELDQNQSGAKDDLAQKVTQVNTLLKQLADLNPRIVNSQTDTVGANGMLDHRDNLLDQLQGLVDVQVMTHAAGDVSITLQGSELVSLNRAEQLSLAPDNSLVNSEGNSVKTQSGAIASLQKYVNDEIPALRSQLNQLAGTWIQQVNDVHQRAYGLDGISGRKLLNGTDASNISVAINDPRQLGHAVARIQSDHFASPNLIADQPLGGQGPNLRLGSPSASGIIQINGTNIAWDSSQSTQQILSNFSAAGVKAQFQPTNGQIVLERDPSQAGPSDITVTDLSGNLSAVLGLAGRPSQPGGQGDTAGLAALDQRARAAVYGISGDRTLQGAFQDLQATVGSSLATRQDQISATKGALETADASRKSVSGVSSDDELLQVNRMQQAFAAAAKVAAAADEMLTTLMQMVK